MKKSSAHLLHIHTLNTGAKRHAGKKNPKKENTDVFYGTGDRARAKQNYIKNAHHMLFYIKRRQEDTKIQWSNNALNNIQPCTVLYQWRK